jgi:hypothetical protein
VGVKQVNCCKLQVVLVGALLAQLSVCYAACLRLHFVKNVSLFFYSNNITVILNKYLLSLPFSKTCIGTNTPSPVPVVELHAVHEYVTIIPVWQERCFSTSVNICAAQTRSIVDVNITFLSLLFLQRIREYKKRDRRVRIGFIWLGMGIPGEMF